MPRWLLSLAVAVSIAAPAMAELPPHERKSDVVYGRKFGVCTTMEVFVPKEKPNGGAVVAVVSGGWVSRYDDINGAAQIFGSEFLRRGYTVFAVMHGCQPKFNILEAIDDMHRAIRFIRHNAKQFQIDPDRIGITGASAGCHLSLMMGVGGTDGNPKAKDVVDRESSRVQSVAGFFPPVDFFNYGKPGSTAEGITKVGPFAPAFDFRERDKLTNTWKPVDDGKRREILKQISPIYHVSEKTPPTLLLHGDRDFLVPLQQSELMIAELKKHQVPCELRVHKGGSHGWEGIDKDAIPIADWFDKHMPKKSK